MLILNDAKLWEILTRNDSRRHKLFQDEVGIQCFKDLPLRLDFWYANDEYRNIYLYVFWRKKKTENGLS